MDLRCCKRIVIYGGTFDPPHVAHVVMPMLAAQAVGADALAYLPAARPPHKPDPARTAARHRLAMLRLTLADLPQATILTDELDRHDGQPSYTVDTLERLAVRLGTGPELRLLMGGDMARIFDQWHKSPRILEVAQPLVMLRPPDNAQRLLADLPAAQRQAWAGRIMELPQMDVSSTLIRQRVKQGLPITAMVLPLVEDYILRQGLYRL